MAVRDLKNVQRGDPISAAQFNHLVNAIKGLALISGADMYIGSDGIPHMRSKGIKKKTEFITVKIDTATADGSNKWTYTGVEMKWDGTDWVEDTSGFSGDIKNHTETDNIATGEQGNGIDVDRLVGTFTIKPLKTEGLRHAMVVTDTNEEPPVDVAWVAVDNAVDGECNE